MHRYTWKSFPRSNKTEKRNPTPICTLRDLERFHKGKTEVGHSRRFHTYIMLHLQCLPRIKKKAKKLMRLCLGQASRVPSNDTYIPHAHTRAVTKTCAWRQPVVTSLALRKSTAYRVTDLVSHHSNFFQVEKWAAVMPVSVLAPLNYLDSRYPWRNSPFIKHSGKICLDLLRGWLTSPYAHHCYCAPAPH